MLDPKSSLSPRLVYATGHITHILLSVIRDLGPAYSKVRGHNCFLCLPPYSLFTRYESKELLKIVSVYCQVMLQSLFLLPFLTVWRSFSCHSRKERASFVRLRKGSQGRSTACIIIIIITSIIAFFLTLN